MSAQFVHVNVARLSNGSTIQNVTLEVVKGLDKDFRGSFITCLGGTVPGMRAKNNRVYVDNPADYAFVSSPDASANSPEPIAAEPDRTDADILADLDETFEILSEMTDAVINSIVKGLVVSGPAGIGKSHTVENRLRYMLAMKSAMNQKEQYECIHGAISSVCLYEKLFEFRSKGQVVVFDDCDGVLYDEDSLNLLKAALDSRKHRIIHWNSDSKYLKRADIPNKFEFEGGIIFITNIKFDQVRSPRLVNHLQAIKSRVHYMDLGIDTLREKMLHIQNVVKKHRLLDEHNFSDKETAEVLDYVTSNRHRLQEISLRTVTKIADLRAAMPQRWQRVAEKNCMKRR